MKFSKELNSLNKRVVSIIYKYNTMILTIAPQASLETDFMRFISLSADVMH